MSVMIETERLIIKTSAVELTDPILDFYFRNKAFFDKYEPVHSDRYYTYEIQKRYQEAELQNIEQGTGAYYYFALKEDPEKIIGSISFVRIRQEPYASTIFGYNLDEKLQGHGYCTEACRAAIKHVLQTNRIHRIEARVRMDNQKSINIMERLGFFREGVEIGGVLIDGKFRDHYRYAFINENY